MDLRVSIVLDILFITKHENDHNFGPNLSIDNILSVLERPNKSKHNFHIKWVKILSLTYALGVSE